MLPLYRLATTNGQRLINITKMASINLDDNKLTFVYNNVKKPIVGSFIMFTGGDNKAETFTYGSNEEAKKEFDSIMYHLKKIDRL